MESLINALQALTNAMNQLEEVKDQCDKNNQDYYHCWTEREEVERISKIFEEELNRIIDARVEEVLIKMRREERTVEE